MTRSPSLSPTVVGTSVPSTPRSPARVAPLHDAGGPGVAALDRMARVLSDLDPASRAVALGQLAAVVHRFSSTGDDRELDAALTHWWSGWVLEAPTPCAAAEA